jgi:PAS domain S-box-containing protein
MKDSKPTYDELEKRIKELESKVELFENNQIKTDIIEQKQIEKKIRESEILYRTLVETSSDGIVLTDLNGKYLFCNTRHADLLGYESSTELIGVDGFTFFPAESQKMATKIFSRLFDEKHIENAVFEIERKDGNRIIAELSATIINDDKGKPVSIMCLMRDITMRKLAEKALKKSEERFRGLIDQAPIGIQVLDMAGMTVWVNKSWEKLWGVTWEEFSKLNYNILKDEQLERKGIMPYLKKAYKGETISVPEAEYDAEETSGIGKKAWVKSSIYPIKDISGEISNIILIHENITKRKMGEIALKKSVQQLRKSQEIAHLGNWEWNIEENTFKLSNEAYNIYGIKGRNQKIMLEDLSKFIHRDDLHIVEENTRKALQLKESVSSEYRIITADGELKWIYANHEAVQLDKDGNPFKMAGVMLDITERKQAENEIKLRNEEYLSINEEYKTQYEKLIKAKEKAEESKKLLQMQNQELQSSQDEIKAINEELFITTNALKESNIKLLKAKEKAEESDHLKTEFINNMSHEIRTPMNGIIGFSDFLNNSNLSNEKRRYYINVIQNSGYQLLRIIDDILEISKLGTKQVETIEKEICLNDLFLNLFSIFDIKAKENKTPLYLKKGLSDKKSIILTDETKLNKILSNLLENALKFTSTGYIEFGYNLVHVQMHGSASQPSIQIYVKDTGIGIKPEKQEIIFERFSQEEKELSQKVGGLGLGLSIAKENAELLRGEITLHSEKGKGAIFFVTIPYKLVNLETEKSNSVHLKTLSYDTTKKYTILIVEDEEVNYLYLDTILENFELDFKILHARNGQEAVEICKENSEIDFIFMDLKMSIMSGFEATKLIKEFRPKLPIVAQTAYSTNREKELAFSAGCDDFVSKPTSEETLNEIIYKYLITNR